MMVLIDSSNYSTSSTRNITKTNNRELDQTDCGSPIGKTDTDRTGRAVVETGFGNRANSVVGF